MSELALQDRTQRRVRRIVGTIHKSASIQVLPCHGSDTIWLSDLYVDGDCGLKLGVGEAFLVGASQSAKLVYIDYNFVMGNLTIFKEEK